MDQPQPPPIEPPAQTKKPRKPRKKKVDIPKFKIDHGNFYVTFK
jgi:hypothetical protein